MACVFAGYGVLLLLPLATANQASCELLALRDSRGMARTWSSFYRHFEYVATVVIFFLAAVGWFLMVLGWFVWSLWRTIDHIQHNHLNLVFGVSSSTVLLLVTTYFLVILVFSFFSFRAGRRHSGEPEDERSGL